MRAFYLRFVNILIAFCWAHVRRDFISVAKDWPKLEGWALQWIQSIGTLYYLNELRITNGNNTQEHIDADAQHHYLGYNPLPGAQLRYFAVSNGQILGLMGFGASAWKVAPRDQFIGWSDEQRLKNLHLVVNNA